MVAANYMEYAVKMARNVWNMLLRWREMCGILFIFVAKCAEYYLLALENFIFVCCCTE
jgi:hypothetical protein